MKINIRNSEREIPEAGRIRSILNEVHKATAHGSLEVMKYIIGKKYTWKTFNKDINNFVKSCIICQRLSQQLQPEKFATIKAETIDDIWEIDVISLPQSYNNTTKVLTVLDVFSKFAWAFPIRDKSQESIIDCLGKIFMSGRRPNRILSDNGLEFKNAALQSFLMKNNVELKHGAPYNPTTQGAIERFNKQN